MCSVEFVPSAARALAKLDRPIQLLIARRLDKLAVDPRIDDIKLQGADDIWRVWIGDCRLLYRIEDERLVVLVIRIGHRRDVYR